MAANGGAEPPEHGGGVNAAESWLARKATDALYSAKSDQCINLLNQHCYNDSSTYFKVHNIAIARYFQGGFSDLKKLLDDLNEVKAFIWFLLHEHAKAYSILDSLFREIEFFDEATALRVCLLFMDVALASRDPSKLVDVIKYVEQTFFRGSIGNLNVIGNVQQESAMKSSSASDLFLSRTSSDEIETLLSTNVTSGQNSALASDGQLKFIGNNYTGSKKQKQPCLSFSLAQKCLLNALHLLDSGLHDSKDKKKLESSISKSGACEGVANGDEREQKPNQLDVTIESSTLRYSDVCKKENRKIKQALLADLAYIELQVGNPLKALIAARTLLDLPDCSRIYIYLGNVYAAESLCLQNRPKEAAEHLLIYLTSKNTFELPYSEEDCEQWQGEKTESTDNHGFLNPEEARGTA